MRVGKRDGRGGAVVTVALVAAYAAATWFRQPALLIPLAAPLLWRIPFEHRWLSAPPGASCRAVADAAQLALAWLLATWALWQHRALPCAICVVAVALLLADRFPQRLAFPRRAGIL